MKPQATCLVKDVDPSALAWLRSVFGQELPSDQRVLLTLLDIGDESFETKRLEAWKTIRLVLDKAAANMGQVANNEFDLAVDEAMTHVRPRQQI